jgi:Protein of unknown function (DUF2442)
MLNKVVETKVLAPHVLRVTFKDGYSGVHDFAWLADEPGPITKPLADPDYFARVFLEYGALTWPNGYDMCPDWLRMEMERGGKIKRPQAAE